VDGEDFFGYLPENRACHGPAVIGALGSVDRDDHRVDRFLRREIPDKGGQVKPFAVSSTRGDLGGARFTCDSDDIALNGFSGAVVAHPFQHFLRLLNG